jgi:thioredoxin-related protein
MVTMATHVVRISLILLIAIAVAGLIVSLGFLDKRDDGLTAPILIRQEALAEAKKLNKRLLLWFSATYRDMPGMDYCALLDRFHNDPEVAQVLGKYFVIKKVDIHELFGGEQVYLEHGSIRGVPAFSVLDSAGNLLADSGHDEATNFGYPDTPEQLDAYCDTMKKACPEMTDAELQILRDKLVEIRAANVPQTQEPATSAPSAGPRECRRFPRRGRRFV